MHGKNTMKCEEAVLKIHEFIRGTMSRGEMEAFIAHVKTCPECYDELETYYTIFVGIKYLEDAGQESYNIPQMLKQDLRKKERSLRRRRVLIKTLICVLLLLLAAGAYLFLEWSGLPADWIY